MRDIPLERLYNKSVYNLSITGLPANSVITDSPTSFLSSRLYQLEKTMELAGDYAEKSLDKLLTTESIIESFGYLRAFLEKSLVLFNKKGRNILHETAEKISSKRINETQFTRLQKKIDAYIRISGRIFSDEEPNVDQVERIAIWLRESPLDLVSDLDLDRLENRKMDGSTVRVPLVMGYNIKVEYESKSKVVSYQFAS